jgi:hypothetical protein
LKVLKVKFMQRKYTDDVWVPSDPGPEHVTDDPPFGVPQFTSDEVECVLQDFDVNKGSSPNGIPPIISNVTPIFKKGRRNNVEDYHGVAILSAIPKRFELLHSGQKLLFLCRNSITRKVEELQCSYFHQH